MTLEEIRAAKQGLEGEIRDFLNQRFAEFAEKTACPVEGVSVLISTYQCMGERIGRSLVSEVDLRINTGL